MKLSLVLAVVCASLVSAKKKPKTTTTRILFTPTFLPKHLTKGWVPEKHDLTCEECKNTCAVAPVPKYLDTYYACIKFKCHDPIKGRKPGCVSTDWGVPPKSTANATSTSKKAKSTKAKSTKVKVKSTKAKSTTPSFITVTSTTAPGATSSLASVSSTSSVTAKASTATSSSSHSLPPLRPSFITSMAPMSMEMEDE